ncbi:hypothetical protein UFOVP1326_47 [uncultured Caudovirales phage]|uniref:Uncharacterized protein n=1 Tax=uncultured Caudovirales phage TaxID=2100421 RepID=A0A6J5RYD7_9CAUD|nr:hypothetical protein UFOVP1326_47 [uncultured Caudovirales phage]CAB4212917.1 hypothetical protein UFOVP1436_44 [uncultured Caudovirales phage]
MRVFATAPGFYDGGRRRVGDEFEVDPSTFKLDAQGQPQIPKWMRPAEEKAEFLAKPKDRKKPIFSHKMQSEKVRKNQTGEDLS